MPHAENETSNGNTADHETQQSQSSQQLTNGEKQLQSKVLSHLHDYPVVHDSVEAYKSHPYGAKSLSLVHSTYQIFVAPFHPLLKMPYSILSPYISRVDELGDASLSKVDNRFPIVKEDTGKLKQSVSDLVGLPFKLVSDGREYVAATWSNEYNRTQAVGVSKHVRALLSTQLKIGADGLELASDYLSKKKHSEASSKKLNDVSVL